MNCKEYQVALRPYMEGSGSAAQRAELERHVVECTDCGSFHKVAHELTCRELTEFLDDYLDGLLSTERQAVFERHLRICVECIDYIAGYREAIAMGKAAYAEPADPALTVAPENLVRAILDARRKLG